MGIRFKIDLGSVLNAFFAFHDRLVVSPGLRLQFFS